jgi:hypothetical protein
MLEYFGKAFRTWFEVVLWILLIVFVIGGGILGYVLTPYRGDHVNYIIIGVMLGGGFGFISVILGGGLVANFLNMVDNIEKLVNKEENIAGVETIKTKENVLEIFQNATHVVKTEDKLLKGAGSSVSICAINLANSNVVPKNFRMFYESYKTYEKNLC